MKPIDFNKLVERMDRAGKEIGKLPTEEAPPDDLYDAIDAIRRSAHDLMLACNFFLTGD